VNPLGLALVVMAWDMGVCSSSRSQVQFSPCQFGWANLASSKKNMQMWNCEVKLWDKIRIRNIIKFLIDLYYVWLMFSWISCYVVIELLWLIDGLILLIEIVCVTMYLMMFEYDMLDILGTMEYQFIYWWSLSNCLKLLNVFKTHPFFVCVCMPWHCVS
jgi:hypothetical protein